MTWKARAQRLTYAVSHIVARLLAVSLFGVRVSGRSNIPSHGGGLICANHQSFFDPIFVGLTIDRPLAVLARRTLFRFAPFRWLINWYNAIPLEREGLSMTGLKLTIKRLQRGELVLIFPEGTRTRDGQLLELKAGFCFLARRAKVPLVPVALDGAFEAWPRHNRWPQLSRIAIVVGPAIEPDCFASWSDEVLLAELQHRIAEAFRESRRLRNGPSNTSTTM